MSVVAQTAIGSERDCYVAPCPCPNPCCSIDPPASLAPSGGLECPGPVGRGDRPVRELAERRSGFYPSCRTQPDSHAHDDSHSDRYPHIYSHAHPPARTHPNADSDTYAHANAKSHANANSHSHAHAYAYSQPHTCSYADSYTHAYTPGQAPLFESGRSLPGADVRAARIGGTVD